MTQVDALEGTGDLVGALDLLVALNRAVPDPERDVRIRDLRISAAAQMAPAAGRASWPPVYDDPFPGLHGQLPEVQAGRLSTELLGGAVAHHGALIVRGALASEQVERLADAIETTHRRKTADAERDEADGGDAPVAALDAGAAAAGAGDEAWYRPVQGTGDSMRKWVAGSGGTWLGDSPTSTEIVLKELEAAGVSGAIAGHLGERPVISLQKSTLRRTLPDYCLIAWHQDGSFLGDDVRTMNVWVALSPCGGDLPTPGLEIVPTRQDGILPVDGILSPISVSYDLVAEQARTTPTVIPEFAAGDAILFDERLLHRTHLAEGMTSVRYALECWFFAPSTVTEVYTPLLA